MRSLQRRFVEQDAVVADDTDRIAPDAGEAADDGGAVELLEFVELAAVDQPGDDLTDVVGRAVVARNHAIDLSGTKPRFPRLHYRHPPPFLPVDVGPPTPPAAA